MNRNSALHSVSSIASESNLSQSSYGNAGFFEKFPSYSKINSSSSIIPSLKLFRRKFLASLKDVIAVLKRKISASPSYTKIHNLKYLFLAATTGLVPVLLLQCCPRGSSLSSSLKVPVGQPYWYTAAMLVSYGS